MRQAGEGTMHGEGEEEMRDEELWCGVVAGSLIKTKTKQKNLWNHFLTTRNKTLFANLLDHKIIIEEG